MLFGFEAMRRRQGLIFFSGSWEEVPGRNHDTGFPASQLRASSEQVTNYQFRITPNILDLGVVGYGGRSRRNEHWPRQIGRAHV